MSPIVSTEVVVSAVCDGATDDAFYSVHQWLCHTCVPDVRPLYKELDDRHDDGLKAAALLKHTLSNGRVIHELVLQHNYTILTFQAVGRDVPSVDDFNTYLLARSQGSR